MVLVLGGFPSGRGCNVLHTWSKDWLSRDVRSHFGDSILA